MKKIIVALLWASYLCSSVFAVNNFVWYHIEKLTVKEFITANTNSSLLQNDIKYMVDFFNWLEDELDK